ncbi:MAG: hypothetical protein JWO67_24 [Streptosporangiaceae bacterium]|nr:hypothetical protein [Streptosporangiaceae bacterium]
MPPSTEPAEVPWAQFQPWFRGQWAQGEHVSLIGPTGSGKTTLALELLTRRDFVTVLGTKPKDRTLDKLIKDQGYTLRREWHERSRRRPLGGPPEPVKVRMSDGSIRDRAHVVLWPEFRRPEDKAVQRDVFDQALGEMFTAGSWCIFADEVFYLCSELGLQHHLTTIWTQGRSLGLTLVGGTQRPAYVPLYMYDQATHLFLWGDNDETNLRRVGGLGGLSANQVRAIVAGLPQHAVCYINTRTRQIVRTRVQL